MLLNTKVNSRTKKKKQDQTKYRGLFAVKTETLPTISNFSREKRQILKVNVKSKND